MSTKPRVMIVDDEETIRKQLKSRLDREGLDAVTASGAEEAMTAFVQGGEVGVVVTDLKMPGKDGFALMKSIQEKYPLCKVIVITGHGEKDVAVQALRQGASDYLEKPFDLDQFTHSVKRCFSEYLLKRDNKDLLARLEARVERVEGRAEDRFWFVSKDPSMGAVNEWLTVLRREAMRGDVEEPSVLILGESGTGKEGIARMVHAGSRRAKGPWIAVNCANFGETLLESELFGHEKGAFTGANQTKRGLFEIARGGTLFLDEIGEMDWKLQAKILRVLQEKVFRRVGGTVDLETDVRIVAATHNNLKEKVQQGRFREDLYHRIARVVVEVPALRDRKQDLISMAREFADRAFKARGKTFPGFSPEAEEGITAYEWPGNVRELLNTVERVALLHQGTGAITFRSINIHPSTPIKTSAPKLEVIQGGGETVAPWEDHPEGYMGLKKKWGETFEREYLLASLARHSGNVSAAAREAKLDRSNFLRLLRRHRLTASSFRKLVPATAPAPQPAAATSSTGTAAVAAGTPTPVTTPKAA